MKTVKVRIAVAVDEYARWVADGCHGQSNERAMRGAGNELHDFWRSFGEPPASCSQVYFIEADVPVPEPVTVKGEVAK